MPNEITAFCTIGKYHHIEVEDTASIFAKYENGAYGSFITSTGEYPGTNRFEISGDSGKIVLEDGILKLWQLKQCVSENIFKSEKSFDEIEYDYQEFFFENNVNPHGEIIQNFVDAIRFGTELIANGIEGINELSISNAAYYSSWCNRSVSIPMNLIVY